MQVDDIFLEIDQTLDKLLYNAFKIKKNACLSLSEQEINIYKQKQKTLVNRLFYLDNLLKEKNDLHIPKNSKAFNVQKKLLKFEQVSSCFIKSLSSKYKVVHFEKRPKIRKSRKKKAYK